MVGLICCFPAVLAVAAMSTRQPIISPMKHRM